MIEYLSFDEWRMWWTAGDATIPANEDQLWDMLDRFRGDDGQ